MAEGNADPKLLKIGDFARLAGTNLRTLRYYEEIGLLHPASRSKGGFRYYRETDVHRLALVQTLQDLGLDLEHIGELINTRVEDPAAHGGPGGNGGSGPGGPGGPGGVGGGGRTELVQRVRHALFEQDRLLERRLREIEDQRHRVADALRKLRECERCPHHPGPHNNFCEPCPVDGDPLPADLSALF